MDIDEFLDRELSAIGLDTEKSEKPENAAYAQPDDNFESSQLPDAIKDRLGRGDLELAEQSYSQLWRILIQLKLKWDRGVYQQMLEISRQFSSALSQAYDEVVKKTSHIYELINRARSSLQEGKKDMAFRLYAEVQEISNSIPNVFFEERKAVQDQILNFYKELSSSTDSELIKKVSGLLQEINQLIDKIKSSIASNEVENAAASYTRCIELYSQIPEGFIMQKNPAGMKLLDIYRVLSVSMEISNLHAQLGQQHLQPQQPEIAPNIDYQLEKAESEYKPVIRDERRIIQAKADERAAHKSAHKKNAYKPKAAVQALQHKEPKKWSMAEASAKSTMLDKKKENVKSNIKRGLYSEAWKDVQEGLGIEPDDVELKALKAQIKTLQ